MITVTPTAIEEVRKFMSEQGSPADKAGLRVAVLPGGCSGFQYGLNIEDENQDDDEILEVSGLRVYQEKVVAPALRKETPEVGFRHQKLALKNAV